MRFLLAFVMLLVPAFVEAQPSRTPKIPSYDGITLPDAENPSKGSISGMTVRVPSGFARTLSSRFSDTYNAADYGLIGDGGSHPLSQRYSTLAAAQAVYPHATALTDEIDWAAIQMAANKAQVSVFIGEEMLGEVILPSGFNVRTNRSVVLNKPVRGRFGSMLNYSGTTGDCITVGSIQPAQYGEQNTGYDLDFVGCRSLVGPNASGPPTGVVEGGSVGLRLVSIQMSRVRIRKVIGFSWAGCFFDTREVLWQAPIVKLNGQDYQTKRANVQQNHIDCGLSGYNGIGILAAAASGLASVGANDITWRDLSTNWIQGQSDGTIQGVDYAGSTSNRWSGIVEVPASGPTGVAFAIYGSFNKFSFGFIEGKIRLGVNSYANTVEADNNGATLASVEDLNNNGSNSIRLGPAASGPAESGYPSNLTVTLGQVACNTWGRTISLSLFADLVPSASALAAVQVYTGPTMANLLAFTRAQAAAGAGETHAPLTLILPASHCYRIDPTGTVNLGAARVVPIN